MEANVLPPKTFSSFCLVLHLLPGLLLLFPLFNDLLDCILPRNKGSAFWAGILGRPPRTLAHAVQFRTTFNNNKNAWLNGSKMWSVRGIHLSLGHCHNTDGPKQIPLDGKDRSWGNLYHHSGHCGCSHWPQLSPLGLLRWFQSFCHGGDGEV